MIQFNLKSNPWRALICAAVAFVFVSSAHADDKKCKAAVKPDKPAKTAKAEKLTVLTDDWTYGGLTKPGLAKLKAARDALRQRDKLFDEQILGLGSVHHGATVARMHTGHMFIYGPPGGAKSMVVDWMLKGEENKTFELQFHQMVPESAIVGGQTRESAMNGMYEVNIQGSLADHQVALIDEADKGTPAVYAGLMGPMADGKVRKGQESVPAALETLYATSNANLPEILEQFMENGMRSTAPALLNRFQFKAFVYNWLGEESQVKLDALYERQRSLKALSKSHPEVLEDAVFLKPEVVDWEALRELGNSIFKPSTLLEVASREFANELRVMTNTQIKESKTRFMGDPQTEQFPYFPSADHSERLRKQIIQVVIASATIDLLLSPLADDGSLEKMTSKPIELDAGSLWRAYTIMTTLGPGRARLKHDGDQVSVNFDWSIDPTKARDEREEKLIKDVMDEQDRFNSLYSKQSDTLRDEIKRRAQFAMDPSALDTMSFEAIMYAFTQQDLEEEGLADHQVKTEEESEEDGDDSKDDKED